MEKETVGATLLNLLFLEQRKIFFSGTINEWNSLLERTMCVDNFKSKLVNSFNFSIALVFLRF